MRTERWLVAVVLCVLASAGLVRAQTIGAGWDLLETDPGTTLEDMNLPAGFFGPGSDPFVGRVYLRGVPFPCFDPDGPGPRPLFCDLLPTDTIVRRPVNAGPAFPTTIPIEIVQLSLVSIEPIKVTIAGSPTEWSVSVNIQVDPGTGAVDPPQVSGTMTLRHETPGAAGGGTFDSVLPVKPYLTFTRVDVPGPVIGPIIAPATLNLTVTGESWSHVANPLIVPGDGQTANVVAGLTSNFFPGCVCATCPLPRPSPVAYSVDGGAFNAARTGAPLTPVPNPAEGLIVPDPRHVPPNDVYALGTSPGAPPGAPPGGWGYATEGEIFQSDGDPLGFPPDGSNVDRMSAALGIGPVPGGPPYLGPFSPNPGAPAPAPLPPGALVGTLGLTPNDNIDGFSFGRDSGDVLFFSVDPAAVGTPGTAVRFHAVISPFGVGAALPLPTNPGGGDPGSEAAGDVYKSLPFAPFGSYIPLHLGTGNWATPATLAANELEIDDVLLGLQAPALNGSAIAPPEDDLDGLELSDVGDPIFGADLIDNSTGIGPPDGIPDRYVFFSIDTASPAYGPVDADDILVTPPGGFTFSVYADGFAHIGLLPGDDIDGLALSDVTVLGVLDPGFDEALFSLHPGSPSVLVGPDLVPATGDEVSAADVFYTSFTGTHFLYAPAPALGLLVSDNLNALDIKPRDPAPPGGGGGPGSKKKLSKEEEARAKHGVKVSQKRKCVMPSTVATIRVTTFQFGADTVNLNGPTTGMRGATLFNPHRAITTIETEMLSMQLNGNSGILGPVIVRAGRDLGLEPSHGLMEPLSTDADFPADSFFDVFVTVDLPNFGLQLHNREPFRVQTPITYYPPFGHMFQGNVPVVLYDAGGNPRGTIDNVFHRPLCQTNTNCDDLNACTADSCQVSSGICQHVPLPDGDGDGICDPSDNCPIVSNPGQGPVLFTETILAVDPTRFCWDTPTNVKGVRGQLALVSSYPVDNVFNAPAATCVPIVGTPTDDYYLIQHDCPAASWQTTFGAEPGRDDTLP
jgi:hypothetical protein